MAARATFINEKHKWQHKMEDQLHEGTTPRSKLKTCQSATRSQKPFERQMTAIPGAIWKT